MGICILRSKLKGDVALLCERAFPELEPTTSRGSISISYFSVQTLLWNGDYRQNGGTTGVSFARGAEEVGC
jgi:hypothetical protein